MLQHRSRDNIHGHVELLSCLLHLQEVGLAPNAPSYARNKQKRKHPEKMKPLESPKEMSRKKKKETSRNFMLGRPMLTSYLFFVAFLNPLFLGLWSNSNLEKPCFDF